MAWELVIQLARVCVFFKLKWKFKKKVQLHEIKPHQESLEILEVHLGALAGE